MTLLFKNDAARLFFILGLVFSLSTSLFASIHHAGATLGKFNVSDGATNYIVPIQLPPGINGMQPKISLKYSSRRGNGLIGIGWSLGGLSGITRCSTSIAVDGYIDGVDYDDNDQFCLNGQRLIPVSGQGTIEY